MAEEIPRERIVKLYVSESFQAKCVKEKNDRFIQEAEVMSDTVFAHVSDTKTPQGILGRRTPDGVYGGRYFRGDSACARS